MTMSNINHWAFWENSYGYYIIGPVRKWGVLSDRQSQNKSSWLMILISILDKEVCLVNLALEDTSIYFPWIPVLKNL